MMLTNESIVQRLQMTPFAHKLSQLALDDIEDLTVTQQGFLASLFNYGILTIETAGEAQNFIFKDAANPQAASREIITAKEHLEEFRHTKHQRNA